MNAPLTLVIANKNYSSWSMRPWVLLRGRGIPFREHMLKFETAEWRDNIARLSPSGLVPVLWEGEPGSGFATWDTLAIAERLHEIRPDSGIWPTPRAAARARAFSCGRNAFRVSRAARRDADEYPQPLPRQGHERRGGERHRPHQRALGGGDGALICSANSARRTPSMRRSPRAW